jgi:transposase
MDGVQEILDLSEVPHFTTLQKFISRIKTLYLRFTFRKTVDLFHSSDETIPITAIDSSGFTSGYCSHYFSERTGKIRKQFLKTSISVDTEQQVITGFVASNSRVHDTRHAVKLLRQCHKTRKSDCYVMDKGYDSEAIHRLIREDLHANSVIPIRSWNNEIIGGTYRQEMAQLFNDTIYPRRQLVENKFSVLKRKFSGDLKARRFRIQIKEIANKMIVCNIYRFLLFLILEVFYRAEILENKERMLKLQLIDKNTQNEFVADVVKSRNIFTHWNSEKNPIEFEKLHLYVKKLKLLLGMCILSEFGFSDEDSVKYSEKLFKETEKGILIKFD